MTEYRLFAESKYEKTCGFYNTYGIVAFVDGEMCRIVKDISMNREHVSEMVKLFNSEELELCHLSRAVEDYLYDFRI